MARTTSETHTVDNLKIEQYMFLIIGHMLLGLIIGIGFFS